VIFWYLHILDVLYGFLPRGWYCCALGRAHVGCEHLLVYYAQMQILHSSESPNNPYLKVLDSLYIDSVVLVRQLKIYRHCFVGYIPTEKFCIAVVDTWWLQTI
jgi:hypothetical protein